MIAPRFINVVIPFEHSKREKELYREIRGRLEGESFSFTVNLMAGRSQRLSGRRIAKR